MRKSLVGIFLSLYLLPHLVNAQQDVQLAVQTGHSSAIVYLAFSKDGQKLASAGADHKVVIWDISKHKQVQILSGHTATVTAVDFHPSQPLVATASSDGQVYIKSLTNGENVWSKKLSPNDGIGLNFSTSGDELLVAGVKLELFHWQKNESTTSEISKVKFVRLNADNSKFVAVGNNGNVFLGDQESLSLIKRYKGNFDKASFSNDGNYLYGAASNGLLKRWNLNGSNLWKGMTITANRFWDSYYDVAVNDTYFIGANRDKMVYVRNHQSGKLESVLKAHESRVLALATSPDGSIIATAGGDRKILLWSTESGTLVSELNGVSNRINDIAYGESGQSIALAYDNGFLKTSYLNADMSVQNQAIKLSGLEKLNKYEVSISKINTYNEGMMVSFQAILRKGTKKANSKNQYKKTKLAEGSWNLTDDELKLSKWQKTVNPSFVLNKNGFSATEISIVQDTVLIGSKMLITNHSDQITAVSQNPQYEQIATASWDGMVKFWNVSDFSLALNYSAMAESDYILTNLDNYYYATKGALRGVGFFMKGEVYSFDQFDTKYNRPDLVFSQLPYISESLVNNYKLAYEKRLSKLKINPDELALNGEIPILRINSEELSFISKSRDYSIKLSGKAEKIPLQSLHILINGVPLYGSKGYPLYNTLGYQEAIKLKLNPGRNEVEVFATNSNGVSSYREIINVNCQVKETPPELYLVTIGASEYVMSEYNLKYASKDARDIAASFKKDKYFNKVHTLEIINENVTSNSLVNISEFVDQADPRDVVIISVAGHGVLSNELDYYLSTYDMDFNSPEEKGIAYQDLEAVLESTQSRQKTLILDACHSGEVDKDEVELTAKAAKVEGNVTFRSVGADVAYKNQVGLKSSFELSKELFADMRSNNGAVVISSAGAAEYAFEGNEWSNGLFTYVMLEGLKSDKADLNNDGIIMLSELQKYLFKEVPRMSGGLQTPTSRVENLNNDFRIK